MNFKYSFFIIILLALNACDSTTELDLKEDTVVLDAYLYAGQAIDSIKVSLSNAASDTTDFETLDDLIITISDDNQSIELEPMGNGYYQKLDFFIETETNYSISFEYKETTISASTYIPAKKEATISLSEIEIEPITPGKPPSGTPHEPIEVTWNNSEGDYYYVLTQNIEENPEYIITALNGNDTRRRFSFITEPQIIDTYNVDARRDIQQYGTHEVIVFRVNPEYAALYETSGTTSNNLVQPPTNVENGLGIFTGVSSDTLILEVTEL